MRTINTLLFITLLPLALLSQKSNQIQSIPAGIKLTIIANWTTDTARISFQNGATSGFDNGADILKSAPSNTTDPTISTLSGSQDLCLNSLPASQEIIDIPVRVKVGITGKYILQIDPNAILNSGSCVMLEDLALSYVQDLRSNSSYSFAISDTTHAPRFILHIGRAPSKTALSPSCSYNTNGMGIITSFGSGNWDCAWMDSLGNTLTSNTNITWADTLKNLAPGTYPVMISGNSGYCYATYYDTVVIDPATPLSINASVGHVNCPGASTGSINTSMVIGGQAPYSYSWSNSCSTSVVQNLSPGVYILVLSDANGCNDTSMYAVQQLSNLSVHFQMSDDTLTMANPTVTFTNQTMGQSNLSWDFGDGSPFSNTYSPNHTFSSSGTFTVELTANDSYCVLKRQEIITILNPTGLAPEEVSENLQIYSYGGHAIVKFGMSGKNALINVYTIEGKLVFAQSC